MYTPFKKSQITDWWVAPENNVMSFTNIFDGEVINGKFLTVGYLDKSQEELATSSNLVVRVTEDGVVTAKGTFYPFEEAHELYLQFLIDVNKINTVIATNWRYYDKIVKNRIVADIFRDGNFQEGVVFDFSPTKNYGGKFTGYSKELNANVVITPFARRNACIKIAIPESVKKAIYNGSFALKKESEERVRKVKEIFNRTFRKGYIIVE